MFFKKWQDKNLESLKLFGDELERLHNILKTSKREDYALDFTKGEVLTRIKIIQDHMLTVSKRFAGLEY